MRKNRVVCIIILLWAAVSLSVAQTRYSREELLDRVFGYMLEETEEEEMDYEQISADLNTLLDHPLDLNRATPQQFAQLHFLTDGQIENLYYYIHEFGPMVDLAELQLVDGLDDYLRCLLLHFVRIDRTTAVSRWSLKDILATSRSTLTTRYHQGMERRRGYTAATSEELADHPNARYLGSAAYATLSYRLTSPQGLQANLTMEKDPGEPLFKNSHRGFDSYSAYLRFSDVGPFRTILVGDYRVAFGQGLVINQSFERFGSDALSPMKSSRGLWAKSSNDEYNFLRGVGASVRLAPSLSLTALYSFRRMDADTVGGSFTRLRSEGYHRTPHEESLRHTVQMHVAAAHLDYTTARLHLGATFYYAHTALPCVPDEKVYNLMSFSGKTQLAGSIDYLYHRRRIKLFGEWALNQQAALATINGISLTPIDRVTLMVVHRYYAPRYDLYFSNAFARLATSNEHGVYLGVDAEVLPYTRLSGYADVFTHPWMRYQVYAPTVGYRAMAKVEVKRSDRFRCSLRWKMRHDQRNLPVADASGHLHEVEDYGVNDLRLTTDYTFRAFTGRTIVEGNHSRSGERGTAWGLVVSQDLSYSFSHPALSLKIHYAYFRTPDYDNRAFLFEDDILGLYQTPLLYGIGHRYALIARWKIADGLRLAMKWSQTFYSDHREGIGSGLEYLDKNHVSDLRLQLVYSFPNRRPADSRKRQ